MESLTAEEPRIPTDFRREAPITCKCPECAEMKKFLQAPGEAMHRFRVREERRNHLEREERLKEYHHNRERLTMVRSIETSLPG